jgi:hypothetical protein
MRCVVASRGQLKDSKGFGLEAVFKCHHLTESTMDPTQSRGAWDLKLRKEIGLSAAIIWDLIRWS